VTIISSSGVTSVRGEKRGGVVDMDKDLEIFVAGLSNAPGAHHLTVFMLKQVAAR
jgi:hypothetical protein